MKRSMVHTCSMYVGTEIRMRIIFVEGANIYSLGGGLSFLQLEGERVILL